MTYKTEVDLLINFLNTNSRHLLIEQHQRSFHYVHSCQAIRLSNIKLPVLLRDTSPSFHYRLPPLLLIQLHELFQHQNKA